ncbi:MAG: 5-formyltetrahydrofolate cyclo-ligase [Sideroxydans sp.]|nr:5-formyltetrahydrofolate cyclo-ligase [Sideroxydans sp.]
MDIQARKQTLRQRIIAARENLAASDRLHLSKKILSSVSSLPAYQQASTVLAYLNFGAELDTEHWVEHALRDGKRVLLPRVNKASKQLELYQVSELQQDVAAGSWGIREPLPERCIKEEAPGTIDLILLPGVAFTRDGGRLGYGGGFYDKLLARLPHRPALVAAAFALQVVAGIPLEDTDQRMDWLVTENETICCNRERE